MKFFITIFGTLQFGKMIGVYLATIFELSMLDNCAHICVVAPVSRIQTDWSNRLLLKEFKEKILIPTKFPKCEKFTESGSFWLDFMNCWIVERSNTWNHCFHQQQIDENLASSMDYLLVNQLHEESYIHVFFFFSLRSLYQSW